MYLGDCVILVYKQLHYFTAAVHSIVFTSPFADEETKIPKGLSKTGPKSHVGEIVKPWFEPMPVHHPVSCHFRGAEGKKRVRKPASRELEAQRDGLGTTKFPLLEGPFKIHTPQWREGSSFPLIYEGSLITKL